MLPQLTIQDLKFEAIHFLRRLSHSPIPELYGTTDGKAIGTYVELQFKRFLTEKYEYLPGNAANGIDFPELEIDLKVTSIRQPQSSCPFRSAHQKVYGLGYHLMVFVYDKNDDPTTQTAHLNFLHAIFVDKNNTADYQTTRGIIELLERDANHDDIVAFLEERNLPLDEIGRDQLADRILQSPPSLGYLTISNALQWRLQYKRVIDVGKQGTVPGVEDLIL